jgi:hypothetical protein
MHILIAGGSRAVEAHSPESRIDCWKFGQAFCGVGGSGDVSQQGVQAHGLKLVGMVLTAGGCVDSVTRGQPPSGHSLPEVATANDEAST